MVRYSRSDFIDMDLYEQRIRKNGYLAVDKDTMISRLLYMQSEAGTAASFAKDVMMHKSKGKYCYLEKNSVYNYLVTCEHCPDHYFHNSKIKSEISLNMKDVLNKLLANGKATEFLSFYCKYRSLEIKSAKVDKMLNVCNTKCGNAKDGTTLYKIPYTVNRQTNARFNYKQFDVIAQIPKEFCHEIMVENGYFLAWGDFAQSDFRIAYNLFLRSEENDKIMNSYTDKYEALARIVARDLGTEFDYERFQQERSLYKRLTLATIYGTENSVVESERDFITTFSAFLMRQPKYVEFVNRILRRIDLGLPIMVESYFGYQQTIAINEYSLNTTKFEVLNSPVQSATSEVVINTVNKILDTFYSLGYTEDDVSLYLTRHDEPIFKMKDCVKKDLWVLKQFSDILVDDWSPLHMDFSFGYQYDVEDGDLLKQYEISIRENAERIDDLQPLTNCNVNYFPIADVFEIDIHYEITDAGTVVAYYCEALNSVEFQLLHTDSSQEQKLLTEEIHATIKQAMGNYAQRAHDAGYRGVIIHSNSLEGQDFRNRMMLKYCKEVSVKMNCAIKLCKYMTCKFCKQNGIESPVMPPEQKDAEWIYSVNNGILKENADGD